MKVFQQKIHQEEIRLAETEEEFRAFCDNNPYAGVANAQVSLKTPPDGVYKIHLANCKELKGDRHVEGQADTKYLKYLADCIETLVLRWPEAKLCGTCCQGNKGDVFDDPYFDAVVRTIK